MLAPARGDTIQFVEKPWDALPNHDVGDEGTLALSIRPAAWFHGETPGVARIYPHDFPPLWLSEGFAEEMSGRSTAARMGQYNPRLLQRFQTANMPLDQLTTLSAYPAALPAVAQLYQSSEKLVRFLMTDAPVDRFPKFFEAMCKGADLPTALAQVYADKYPTYDAFAQRYARLAR